MLLWNINSRSTNVMYFTSLILSPSYLVFDCMFILSLLRLASILLPGKVIGDIVWPIKTLGISPISYLLVLLSLLDNLYL